LTQGEVWQERKWGHTRGTEKKDREINHTAIAGTERLKEKGNCATEEKTSEKMAGCLKERQNGDILIVEGTKLVCCI